MISIDLLKHIISFLDWTSDFDTVKILFVCFKFSDDEKEHTINYWKKYTKFDVNKCCCSILYSVNGKRHRTDGPAVITLDFDRFIDKGLSKYVQMASSLRVWYKNGLVHRDNGQPAYFSKNEFRWYINGLNHREDGPAYIDDRCQEWWQHGKRHRVDGPAVIYSNGDVEYWQNDVKK